MDKKTIIIITYVIVALFLIAFLLIKRKSTTTSKTGKIVPCWDGSSVGDGCRSSPSSALSRALKKTGNYNPVPPLDLHLVFTRNNRHHNLFSLSAAYQNPDLYSPDLNSSINTNGEAEVFKFKINRLTSSNSEAEFVYGISGDIYLFHSGEQKIIKISALLDTGSKELIIQTDQSLKLHEKEKEVYQEIMDNGTWKTGYSCLIPGSDKTIAYGGGAVDTEVYNTYVVNHKNNAVGLNISAVLSGSLIYNICGLIPGFEYDVIDSGFINFLFEGMSNCQRGFILDLKNDVFTMGEIEKTQKKIDLLTQAELRNLFTNPPPIPYYMTYLDSVNGVKPTQDVFIIFDSGNTFMTVSNDYTRRLIQTAIGAQSFDDVETHGDVTFGFKNDIFMKSSIKLSMDESYVVLQSPFKSQDPTGYNSEFNVIIVGLTFQLGRVISYDIDGLAMYID